MKPLTIAPPPVPLKTEIFFGLDQLQTTVASFNKTGNKRGVLFVDEAIEKTIGAKLQKLLQLEVVIVPKTLGKTREAKAFLEDCLFEKQYGKDTLMIAVGGGTLTDLIGFLASTYMRKAPLILIPTTLLAMVDAAIGGKTGIDTPFGKNLIGSFYLPYAIFIEPNFLQELPEKERRNGMSEIAKIGLVYRSLIWDRCKEPIEDLPSLIHMAIEGKVKIVNQDFDEKKGLRHILNFGHTVGHALEFLSDYQISHGEAVALGCMAESHLSHLLGFLDKKECEKILRFYRDQGYRFPLFDPSQFKKAMAMDKKAIVGRARFVLIDRIGHAIEFDGAYCQSAKEDVLDQLICWMQNAQSHNYTL